MTYTFNDQAIFEAVPGAKAIVCRPIGMPGFRWKTYAAGVVLALNSKGSTSALELGEAIHKAMLNSVKESLSKESPSMKLVDILARELKAWPESWGIFCVATKVEGNDAAWFNYRNPVFKDGGWQDLGSVELWLSQEPEDRKEVVVRRFEWQAAVDALNAPKVDIADGNVRLGALIEMGYLHLETPTYDFSAWPPERFDCGLLPSLHVQSFGRVKRHQPVEPKPKSTAQENTEFLEARVKLLEAEQREAEIERMVKYSPCGRSGFALDFCEALYAAGCRPPVNTGK